MGALHTQVQGQDTAARAVQELQDFSYIVTHDLASEFRHVAEFSKQLAEDVAGDATNSSRARMIAEAAGRCQAMLSAVYLHSTMQSHELAPRSWPARSVVERALVELGLSEIEAVERIKVDVSGEVFADARLLITALRLAIANALQFSREGVEHSVEITGWTDRSGAWTVEIKDNGEGLARSYREKAFGMFWRLDPDTPGTGAGLAMIRRIARRHGGEARFLDAPVGARLEITIPNREA